MPPSLVPIAILLAFTHSGCSGASRQRDTDVRPTISGLTEHPIIGVLGLPLGSVAEIQATVVAGRELNTKAYASIYLLRVTEVAGHPLPEPRLLEFWLPAFVRVDLAHDEFALYELKTGKKAAQLDSVQIAKLEEGYVGKQMRLVVYETGGYFGMPDDLPKEVAAVPHLPFGFSTSLVVLAERP